MEITLGRARIPLPNHVGPDHFLDLPNAVEVSKEQVQEAWELAYAELTDKLTALGQCGTLYLVFGLQGSGKSTWIQRNAERLGPHAIFLDGPLPSQRRRARAIAIAKAAGCKCLGVWIDTPYEVAIERNAVRPGLACIPKAAIRHVLGELEPPTLAEGFSEVLHVTSAAGQHQPITKAIYRGQ
jgi:predicted kinase